MKYAIPEYTVLSHDLLEGSYLRCGLATDVLLMDGYPSKFMSFTTRQNRWIRGDWQICNWLCKYIQNEVEQIIKQLNRQIDVIRIRDITDQPHLEREVILVKVSAPTSKRAEILAIIQPFRASVVDVAPSSITIQMTGDAEKSEALLRVIRPYGIKNIARTGATGFTRD